MHWYIYTSVCWRNNPWMVYSRPLMTINHHFSWLTGDGPHYQFELLSSSGNQVRVQCPCSPCKIPLFCYFDPCTWKLLVCPVGSRSPPPFPLKLTPLSWEGLVMGIGTRHDLRRNDGGCGVGDELWWVRHRWLSRSKRPWGPLVKSF